MKALIDAPTSTMSPPTEVESMYGTSASDEPFDMKSRCSRSPGCWAMSRRRAGFGARRSRGTRLARRGGRHEREQERQGEKDAGGGSPPAFHQTAGEDHHREGDQGHGQDHDPSRCGLDQEGRGRRLVHSCGLLLRSIASLSRSTISSSSSSIRSRRYPTTGSGK